MTLRKLEHLALIHKIFPKYLKIIPLFKEV